MSNKSLVRKKSPRIQNWHSLNYYHPKCIIILMVKGIFTAFLLFNVFHITPHNTKRALRITSYLVECAVATEPRSGWRGGLWSGLNRTKLERGALLVIRGLGGTKNTQGGMRSRLQLTYNSVCNLSEDKSFVMKSIYLISISTEHFISTRRQIKM